MFTNILAAISANCAAYVNDVMQYPNPLTVYIGFALCFAAPHIDKRISEEEKEKELVATQKN
jgi:hypothetical protein